MLYYVHKSIICFVYVLVYSACISNVGMQNIKHNLKHSVSLADYFLVSVIQRNMKDDFSKSCRFCCVCVFQMETSTKSNLQTLIAASLTTSNKNNHNNQAQLSSFI